MWFGTRITALALLRITALALLRITALALRRGGSGSWRRNDSGRRPSEADRPARARIDRPDDVVQLFLWNGNLVREPAVGQQGEDVRSFVLAEAEPRAGAGVHRDVDFFAPLGHAELATDGAAHLAGLAGGARPDHHRDHPRD